ncbi:MAG: LytR family transcriptional regulator [Glaciihabitans sp.]|jgi:LCP family protein required for cell wall assembly|nr:LytR family transcriptional regulator [Glaciihabitans sp.]
MSGSRSEGSEPPKVLTVARHGRLKKPGPWGALGRIIAVALAVLLVSGGSVAAFAIAGIYNNLNPNGSNPRLHSALPVPPTIGAYPGGFNILIVGSDTRVGQGGIGGSTDTSILNDVTMLLHVSGDHTNATAISFPRDMIVPIAACQVGGGVSAPMNTALYYGGSNDKAPGAGLPCAVKTIEQFTGLSIQFAGLITFKGVIEVTNAVGGVPVCVQGNLNDKEVGLHLTSGTHVLKGYQALQFLRSRHGVGDGSDLGRISSQQVYLSSLVRTLKSSNTLSNIPELYKIAEAATRNMELSQGFNSPDTLFAIAQALKNIPLNSVIFAQYPGTTAGTGIYAGKVQPLLGPGNALIALIKSDKPFTLGTAAGNRGSVVGKAPKAATPKPTTSPTAPPKNVTVLNGVIGQPSSQYTCSRAFGQ